jgi:TRAP-type transport system periplasmic protein
MKILTCTALVAGIWACTALAQDSVTLASPAPAPAAINSFLAQWAEDVTQDSGGALKVTLVPGGVLGREGQLRDRVANGVVDMAWDFQGYYPGNYDRSAVVEQPFQFDTAGEGSRAFQAIYEQGLLGTEYQDVKVLGLFTFPNASLMLVKPMDNLEAMSGRKITAQNPTMQAAAEALGGVALNLGIPDWYQALSRGTIDGAIVTFTAVPAFRLNEVMTDFIDVQLGGNPAMFIMSPARSDGLSDAAKAAIDRHSGQAFSESIGAFMEAVNEKSKGLAAQGDNRVRQLDDETAQVWRTRLEPLTQSWLAADPDRAAIREAYLAELGHGNH